MNPSTEPFFASKTMVLLGLSFTCVAGLVVLGVAVKVAFGVDAFEMIAAGILSITGQSGGGIYRNVKTDGAIRLAQAQQGPPPSSPPPES